MVLDATITAIVSRFNQSREIMKDLTLLSPDRLISYAKENHETPRDAFMNISNCLPNVDVTLLKTEYFLFSKSFHGLLDGILPTHLHKSINDTENINDSCEDEENEQNSSEYESLNVDSTLIVQKILQIFSQYGIIHAFLNLYMVYKALLIIPASSSSAERAFSMVFSYLF